MDKPTFDGKPDSVFRILRAGPDACADACILALEHAALQQWERAAQALQIAAARSSDPWATRATDYAAWLRAQA